MRAIDPGSLSRNNLAYREPALYDELLADSSLAADLTALAAAGHRSARTVLDLGCGTARLLAELHALGWAGTGVDVQPDLLAWARRTHPDLQLVTGDLRTVRLGATFDLITCVGNTLSYLHTDQELAAAFATVAAHSRSGTLLVLDTLTGTGRATTSSSEIRTSLGAAVVDTVSDWDAAAGILTSVRTWRFAGGRVEQDELRRRSWDRDLLADQVRAVGFDTVPVDRSATTLCAVRRR